MLIASLTVADTPTSSRFSPSTSSSRERASCRSLTTGVADMASTARSGFTARALAASPRSTCAALGHVVGGAVLDVVDLVDDEHVDAVVVDEAGARDLAWPGSIS